MTATKQSQEGAPVRFLTGLGCSDHLDADRFNDHLVQPNDEGVYHGPHPNAELAGRGWQVCTVEHDGRTSFVPVHPTHFEVIA